LETHVGQDIVPRRRLVVAALVTSVCAFLWSGCAARGAPPDGKLIPPLLTWLGEFTRPAGTAYPALTGPDRFGSISGLVHDMASKSWLAVSDDREDTRVAWVSVAFTEGRLDVTPTRMLRLRPGDGVPARVVTQADLEAITALPDGTFILAEEGHIRDGEVWQPLLMHMNNQGVVLRLIEFPAAFQITGDEKTGLRDNQGVESVTRTPDGRLIAGLEQPLRQDGTVTFERGAPAKLIEFLPSGDTFTPGRVWNYMLSPTPKVEGYTQTCGDGENGLVDMVALSDTRIVTMERSCIVDDARERTANTVHLYFVDLTVNPVRKSLLLDFDTITKRLPPELWQLENFEALAFGPIVDNRRTLLVASDDNFRATQKTAFLLFGMR
jgi:hypothetical protein